MPSINSVVIAGHLGRDAEVKFTKDGKAWVPFSVAVTEKYKSGNEWKERTVWLSCKWWGCYENVGEWLTKGRGVVVTGRLDVNSYEDKNGVKRNDVEINVAKCVPVDSSFFRKREARDDRPPASKPMETDWGGSATDDDVPF